MGLQHELDPWSVVSLHISLPQQLAEIGGYSSLSAQAEIGVDETKWDDFDCQLLPVGDDLFVLTHGLVVLCHLVMVHRIPCL